MAELYCGGFEIKSGDDLIFGLYAYGDSSSQEKRLIPYTEYKKLVCEYKKGPWCGNYPISDIIQDVKSHDIKQSILGNITVACPTLCENLEIVILEPPRKSDNSKLATWKQTREERPDNRSRRLFTSDIDTDSCILIETDTQNKNSFLSFSNIALSEKGTFLVCAGDMFGVEPGFSLGPNENVSKGLTPVGRNSKQRNISSGYTAGTSWLTIRPKDQDNPCLKLKFDFRPIKLKPEQLKRMFEDVYKKHIELLFDKTLPTSILLKQGRDFRKNIFQRLEVLKSIIDPYFEDSKRTFSLSMAISQITQNPHKKLQNTRILKPVHEVSNPVYDDIEKIIPFAHRQDDDSIVFLQMEDEIAEINYDTPPNRFVKYAVQYFHQQLLELSREFDRLMGSPANGANEDISPPRYKEAKETADTLRKKINPLLNSPFFKDIKSSNTNISQNQVLLKDERYRKVMTDYLRYISRIELNDRFEKFFENPLKWLPELYEYWCFFELDRMIRTIDGINGAPIIIQQSQISDGQLQNNKLKVKYKFNDKDLTLYYNFSSSPRRQYQSYSVGLRPDLALKIGTDLFFFDAKYRVEQEFEDFIRTKEKEEEGKETTRIEQERRGKFLLADIYKMHTYRDALSSTESPRTNKSGIWVVALYPGTVSKLWADTPLRPNIELNDSGMVTQNLPKGGVGAIALKPNSEKDELTLKSFLENLIQICTAPVSSE